MDERERRRRAVAVREAVLGADHVRRARARETPFNREMQDLITRYAWGEVWLRPGLPRDTRRLVTLAMLAALGRLEELKLHVRGAVRGGLPRDQVKEVLLHAAVYCGVPAAHAAFHAAEEALGQLDAEAAVRPAGRGRRPRPGRAAPRTRSTAARPPSPGRRGGRR